MEKLVFALLSGIYFELRITRTPNNWTLEGSCYRKSTLYSVGIAVHTASKCGTQRSIRYVTLHFPDRRSAASIRYRNGAEITVHGVNRSPTQYDFCAGAKAIWYSVIIT